MRAAVRTGRAIGLVLAVSALAVGCSTGSGGLRTLRADPMATVIPSGVTSQSESDRDGGVSLGIEVPANLIRTLRVSDPVAAVVELDRAAQAAGWTVVQHLGSLVPPVGATYQRTSAGRHLQMAVTWDGSDAGVEALSTAGAASPETTPKAR